MVGDTIITAIDDLTADPELHQTQSGAAVADFTVAPAPRAYDHNAGGRRDGDTLLMCCSVWRETVENVAESLHEGTCVIVQSRLTQRSYDTQQGERRTVVKLQVDEVGSFPRRTRTQAIHAAPSDGGGCRSNSRGQQGVSQWGGGYGNGQTGYGQGSANHDAPTGGSLEDPWCSAPVGSATPSSDEPPF